MVEIKKGYNLILNTYEGDADSYSVVIHNYENYEDALFFIKLAEKFYPYWKSTDDNKCFGGSSNISSKYKEIFESVLTKYGPKDLVNEYAKVKMKDEDGSEALYMAGDYILETIGYCSEGYSSIDTCRTVDYIALYKINEDPEEIDIEK